MKGKTPANKFRVNTTLLSYETNGVYGDDSLVNVENANKQENLCYSNRILNILMIGTELFRKKDPIN